MTAHHESTATNHALRRAIRLVGIANLAYFGVEFAVALKIGSVSLFADSIDFLEDASLNLLVLIALNWSAQGRSRIGKMLAGLLLVPGLATLWTAWSKFATMAPPHPLPLSITGMGAFAVNLTCAFVLTRYRNDTSSLVKAAFLSARNDALANIAIIIAGLATAYSLSAWPDLIVGIAIALLNADAAREVWKAAAKEHPAARA
jgi:Co/Zn/Cd efflux system component